MTKARQHWDEFGISNGADGFNWDDKKGGVYVSQEDNRTVIVFQLRMWLKLLLYWVCSTGILLEIAIWGDDYFKPEIQAEFYIVPN